MTKLLLTTALLLSFFISSSQNCKWSVWKVTRDTIYYLSEPIDVGTELRKGEIFLQGLIVGNSRLLMANFKNDTMKNPEQIILRSKDDYLLAKTVTVDKGILLAKTTITFGGPKPVKKETYISDLESKENRFTCFLISQTDIQRFKNLDLLSFEVDGLTIELTKSTSKKLRTMFGCIE